MTKISAGQSVNCFSILRLSLNTLISNPIIFFPLCILMFIYLLAIEILYFLPYDPMVSFFGPIITKLWSVTYIHYPNYMFLLPVLFQSVKPMIYIFGSSFWFAMMISIIEAINNEKKVVLHTLFKEIWKIYVHLVLATVLSYCLYLVFDRAYELIFQRALRIRSETGIFFFIKKLVITTRPYTYLGFGVLLTTLFAFVLPIIVLDKKKILPAIKLNFKKLWKSFGLVFTLVLIPTLLYIPILLLRNVTFDVAKLIPTIHLIMLIVSIIMSVLLDALIYIAVTSFYLLTGESK